MLLYADYCFTKFVIKVIQALDIFFFFWDLGNWTQVFHDLVSYLRNECIYKTQDQIYIIKPPR